MIYNNSNLFCKSWIVHQVDAMNKIIWKDGRTQHFLYPVALKTHSVLLCSFIVPRIICIPGLQFLQQTEIQKYTHNYEYTYVYTY